MRRLLGLTVLVVLILCSGLAVAAAAANEYPAGSPPQVESTETGAQVLSEQAQRPAGSSSLPFTGADVAELAAIGAGAVVLGGVLVRARRLRATS